LDDLIARELVSILPRLRRFARGLAGSAADADDIVQTACEKAVEKIHQWQPGTRLDSWMFRIVQTVHVDWRRSERARTKHLELVADNAAASVDGQSAFEAYATMETVRKFLGEMPGDQRSILLLVCVEGFSYRETSEILGIPIGTVMSRLARGRAALHGALGRSVDLAETASATAPEATQEM
jgi:RNA polymerase sigma-70 factor (ECF subfamily)